MPWKILRQVVLVTWRASLTHLVLGGSGAVVARRALFAAARALEALAEVVEHGHAATLHAAVAQRVHVRQVVLVYLARRGAAPGRRFLCKVNKRV